MQNPALTRGLFGFVSLCACVSAAVVGTAYAAETEQQNPTTVKPHQYAYIVYFLPADRECLPGYQERLDRHFTAIQSWYRDEMERNGFGPMTFPLERDEDGKLVIHVVKGTRAYKEGERISSSEKYEQVKGPLLKEGIDISHEHIFLIGNTSFNSEKDGVIITKGFSDYVGGGGNSNGVAWICDFPWLDPLNLPKKTPKVLDDGVRPYTLGGHIVTYTGGSAHEFGHALGLPHNAQTDEDFEKYGWALMGSGNYHLFEERLGEPTRTKGAYLTKPHATALSSHPLFTRNTKDIDVEPTMTWHDIKFTAGDDVYTISGRVESTPRVYAVLAYHDEMRVGSDYDANSWVANVNPDGTFCVTVGNLKPGMFESRLRCYVTNGKFKELTHRFTLDESLKIPATALKRQTLFELYARPAIEAEDTQALSTAVKKLSKVDDIYCRRAQAYLHTLSMRDQAPMLNPADVADEIEEISLASLKWTDATVEAGSPHTGRYWGYTPLESGSKIHQDGIFAYGNSHYTYEIDGKWEKLVGTCGFQNFSCSDAIFIIKCDDKIVYNTGIVKDWTERTYEINLKGVKKLELITDGNGSAWGDEGTWYSPMLERKAKKKPTKK